MRMRQKPSSQYLPKKVGKATVCFRVRFQISPLRLVQLRWPAALWCIFHLLFLCQDLSVQRMLSWTNFSRKRLKRNRLTNNQKKRRSTSSVDLLKSKMSVVRCEVRLNVFAKRTEHSLFCRKRLKRLSLDVQRGLVKAAAEAVQKFSDLPTADMARFVSPAALASR